MSNNKACPCCGSIEAKHDTDCALTSYLRDVTRVELAPDHVAHLVEPASSAVLVLNLVVASAEELAAAFSLWENEYRQNPDDFFTNDEKAAMELADIGTRQAICLQAYLRQVKSTT